MVKKQKSKSLENDTLSRFKFREGQKVGLFVLNENKVGLSSAKFKILRLRPNGNMVLKLVGEFEGDF